MCFLKGLAESYNTVKIQILLMKTLPNINKVFSLAIQQERWLSSVLGALIETKILFDSTVKPHIWKPPQVFWKQ